MKKSITCILPLISLLLLSHLASAQYQPVLSANKTEYAIGIEVNDGVIDGVLRVEGDTNLNQLNYKKVYLTSEFNPESHIGYVRENIAEGKIWFYNNSDEQEYLVMDLQLEEGDTFDTFYEHGCDEYNPGGITATVSEVALIENRKVITFNRKFGAGFICDSLKFIEGVGPNATFFFQSTNIDFNWSGFAYKICTMYREDTLSYQIESDPDLCWTTISLEELDDSDPFFSIAPNPVADFFVLEKKSTALESYHSINFVLFDLTGKKILSLKNSDSSMEAIEVPLLPAGCYIYQIFTSEKLLQSGKLIKN
jgi:Secretion system C-terminal sorting domain